MSELSLHNQLRRLAGLPVDYHREASTARALQESKQTKTQPLTEARKVPSRKHEVEKKTPENMKKCVEQAEKALDHVEEAIACLERIPAIDFDGAVPHMIAELEAVINDDDDGVSMTSTVNKIQKAYRSYRREETSADRAAEEAEEAIVRQEEDDTVQSKLADMKPLLHIGSKPPKMKKKGNSIEGFVANLADDTETEVTVEFDYNPGKPEQTNPDDDEFGPEEVSTIEIYNVVTADGEEIEPETLELGDAQEEIEALITGEGETEIVKEDHFKVGQMVKDNDGKKWKVSKIKNEGDDDEKYVVKCTDSGDTKTLSPKELKESMHFYNQSNYSDWEKDVSDPVNVSDGSSNKDKVWDEPGNPENDRDESPHQLRNPMSAGTSPQDQSVGDEAKVTVPASIKKALQDEINQARAEAKKLDVRDKEAFHFYNDLANAFEDLLNHLKGGTRYDVKQAQIYMTSLMGPMLHKVPATVVNFIARGGENLSLKDYWKPLDKKYPITGPRNVLK